MNNTKRKKLEEAYKLLTAAWGIVDEILDEERYALDRTPAMLKSGSNYDRLENAVSQLRGASNHIDGAIACIKEASE